MTRVTVLTPAGVAGVAVLALDSRPESPLSLADGRGRPLAWPAPGRFKRARLLIGDRFLDDVLVVGKDPGAELHIHGGTGVVQAVIGALTGAQTGAQSGARPTSPAGQAPAGLRAARARASGLHGALRRLAEAVASRSGSEISEGLRETIQQVLARVPLARRLERPATVRLVGRPNVGKSTLFNALLLEDRSLVSPEAGTTRDSVSTLASWAGVQLRLEDTQGGADVEFHRPGADLRVHVLASLDEPCPASGARGGALIRVLGKADQRTLGGSAGVSGISGAGVSALQARIVAALGAGGTEQDDVLAPVDPDFRRRLRLALAGSAAK